MSLRVTIAMAIALKITKVVKITRKYKMLLQKRQQISALGF